jgi:hypothetical protein
MRERQKRRKKKSIYDAENEWKTHELVYAFSILIVVKGRREREREREGGQATIHRKKYSRRKKRETKSSGNVC